MDSQKPGGKQFSDQVNQMLATAKEMESVLNCKLEQIDKLSNEKSEMAKKEAMKIKTDLEEIRRLSLVKTAEGEEALKAKIMEVNKRIETITRKAAETQTQIVQLQKELMEEAAAKAEGVKNAINSIQLTEEEKARMINGVEAVVNQAKAKFNEMYAALENAVDMYKQTLDEIRQITTDILKALSLNDKRICKEDADLVLNRVLTFEKHAAMRTEFAIKLLQDVRKIVEMNVDACTADFVSKSILLRRVEYFSKLLNTFCPSIVRPDVDCPAAIVRRSPRARSQ